MAIHFISGKPGNGKSLYAVRLIIDELVHGNRTVVTNVALKEKELREYLDKEYPSFMGDLSSRLRILTTEETGQFWLIRGAALSLAGVDKLDEKQGTRLDFGTVYIGGAGLAEELSAHGVPVEKRETGFVTNAYALPGVMYVIDEIHIHFDARNW